MSKSRKEWLNWGVEQLAQADIEEAKYDAWILLEEATGLTRANYYGNPDQEVEETQGIHYQEMIKRRSTRVPLQHITGVQEFMGLRFQVNESVLIPRQDTECLVEEVLEELMPGNQVLDMCTGSGCILISLLKVGKGISGTGVDISEDALKVARANAKALKVDAHLEQSDLFDQVVGTFDVIVSNPPYIPTQVIEGLAEEVKLHDPMLALDGKEDGLYFYRRIIKESKDHLTKDGKLFFEIGHDQGYDVAQIMEEAGFTEVTVKKDLAGLDRVVAGRL